MIKKKKKVDEYYVSSNNPIKSGEKYLCIKDVVMSDNTISFTKGKFYTSKGDNHLTNNNRNTRHQVSFVQDENTFLTIHFKLAIKA